MLHPPALGRDAGAPCRRCCAGKGRARRLSSVNLPRSSSRTSNADWLQSQRGPSSGRTSEQLRCLRSRLELSALDFDDLRVDAIGDRRPDYARPVSAKTGSVPKLPTMARRGFMYRLLRISSITSGSAVFSASTRPCSASCTSGSSRTVLREHLRDHDLAALDRALLRLGKPQLDPVHLARRKTSRGKLGEGGLTQNE